MEESSTKALIFAVSIFVTLVIVSLVIASFGQIKKAYSLTKNTDISIHDQFDSIYLVYDGKVLNGMELLNTVKKFEEETQIVIAYPANASVKSQASAAGIRETEQLKKLFEGNTYLGGHRFRYENKYAVTVKENGAKTTITFTKK